MRPRQREVFDAIRSSIDSREQIIAFVDGPGGSGKTFLYETIVSYVRANNGIALAVASSGISAQLLPLGRTLHSRFKLPLAIRENSVCSISKQSELARLIRASKIIVWDEAPMMQRYHLEALDRSLQDLCDDERHF